MDKTGEKKPRNQRKQRKHSRAKKVEVVKDRLDGNTREFTAAKHDVHTNLVTRWQKDPTISNEAKSSINKSLLKIWKLSSDETARRLSHKETREAISDRDLITIMGIAVDKLEKINNLAGDAKGTKDDPFHGEIIFGFGPVRTE